jgi:hypothetical protein
MTNLAVRPRLQDAATSMSESARSGAYCMRRREETLNSRALISPTKAGSNGLGVGPILDWTIRMIIVARSIISVGMTFHRDK